MRILLVEDDITINQNIRDYLVQERFEVEVAFDGFIAEKLLRKNEYDCVILDVNLPHKNGYDICRSFRQYNTATPVLFLTAFDDLEDKVHGYESGADDYLTKPFFVKELHLRINSLVKRRSNASGAGDVISAGDIVINQKAKTVQRDGKEIQLTPREYQILSTLVAADGALVSKKELIREIWGSAFDANTNNIEVFINFLRNKIDKPFDKHLIKTKVGYGYYLEI